MLKFSFLKKTRIKRQKNAINLREIFLQIKTHNYKNIFIRNSTFSSQWTWFSYKLIMFITYSKKLTLRFLSLCLISSEEDCTQCTGCEYKNVSQELQVRFLKIQLNVDPLSGLWNIVLFDEKILRRHLKEIDIKMLQKWDDRLRL